MNELQKNDYETSASGIKVHIIMTELKIMDLVDYSNCLDQRVEGFFVYYKLT